MHDPLPLLQSGRFPGISRRRLETLQVNLGYRCNQQCVHCHVNAGPRRTEQMDRATVALVLEYLRLSSASVLDITGGAPELNPHFRDLVVSASKITETIIDRCNLTILEEPGFEDLPEFLARHRVTVTASLPCYLEDNVDRQRGRGVFRSSMTALRRLNALGYGDPTAGLELNLVYNPQGPVLPPSQEILEVDYRRELKKRFGIRFNHLFVLCNMPISRFGSMLISKGELHRYLDLLREAHREENLEQVMCRSLLSVDWQGYVYDCDFNQMLGLPLGRSGTGSPHLSDLIGRDLEGDAIHVKDHCFGCTAGQGSSCGGALF